MVLNCKTIYFQEQANGFDLNHIFKANNEFSKQVNGFNFEPYVKSK